MIVVNAEAAYRAHSFDHIVASIQSFDAIARTLMRGTTFCL